MSKNDILTALRSCEFMPERVLRAITGLSKEALHTEIEALRAQGYDAARTLRGVHLVPHGDEVWGACIRKFLRAEWAGSRIDYEEVIDSTNLRARALGQAGAPHGTLVIADMQTAGRGRMTRKWESQSGDSILMSLLLRPKDTPPQDATGIVLIAALAMCAACRTEGADVRIKWPNDLIADGKKLCGMLLEMDATAERVNFAVAGVGLNVHAFPYAEDLKHATCLDKACGHEVSRARVTANFLYEFERLYDLWCAEGIEAILPLYREHSITLGSRVRVIGLTETFEAQAEDIRADGSLLVRRDDGTVQAVHAGDVSVRGVMDYV